MKTTTTFLMIAIFSLISLLAVAQIPNDGAILTLDQPALTVKSGEESTVIIEIVRSKRFQKSKIGEPWVGSSVKGLTYNVATTENDDSYILTIKADEGMEPTNHTLVINGDRKWGRKIRATLLTVEVVNPEAAISAKR